MQKKFTARDFDFEKYEPSFWALNAWWMAPAAVFALTVALTVFSFPPSKAMAFAYVFAAPACYWALTKPRFKTYALVMLAAQAVAWTIILAWLHHVTWGGLLLLGPFTGAWIGVWHLAVWRALRDFVGRPFLVRVAIMLGLAALWVLIEWTRTWLLSGFPWLPLGASQWRNIAVLQIASFTGQGGISFMLIVFNFAFAAYMHRLFRERQSGMRRRSPEFSVALLVLLFAVVPFLADVWVHKRPENVESYGRFGLVQPDIPQSVKWSRENSDLSFDTLASLSIISSQMAADIIIWPEAAPPYAVHGWPDSDKLRAWLDEVATKAKAPILTGIVTEDDAFYNAACVVDPTRGGVQPGVYKKRHLVPFGEYVPLRPLLGWLEKVSDVSSGDTKAGTSAQPLFVRSGGKLFVAGMLICYEDIFPELARANARMGADVHVVVTNNGWFGEGGAAYQHAAHSVLRAVETRRPVIRCGNSGWSGWIDEYGVIRGEMTNRDGTIYFRGTDTFAVTRDKRWTSQQSFYVEHGDWFMGVCGVLVIFGCAMARFYLPRNTTPPTYAETVPTE
ncbi:MAG: apolipoprotein N-acyltransferase [Opitutaceae bacterium]|jgi:apolipoprotein N-acyltransferase|nr:apolipoprotein N-acyltransferase [Opitutaceae bacterium]